MVTILDRGQSHKLYRELMKQCPHYFKSKEGVEYVTDWSEITRFEIFTGERVGVLYKMGNYENFVVDLIRKDGELKLHGRIITPYNGVIIIPKIGNKFILEDQYRYPTCGIHIAFPRGHCEPNCSPEKEAARETQEELGVELKNPVFIGRTYPETNSNAWYCSVYTGEVEGLKFDG